MALPKILRGPVSLSVLLTAVEVIIYVSLVRWSAVAGASTSTEPLDLLMATRALDGAGGLFTGVATTWYVVFTYFILRSTDKTRRLETEPLLALTWQGGEKPEGECVNGCDLISKEFEKAFVEMGGVGPFATDNAQRYWYLQVENINNARLGRVEVEVRVSLIDSGKFDIQLRNPQVLVFSNSYAALDRNKKLTTTVLDLGCVFTAARVQLEIGKVEYCAVGSSDVLTEFSGSGPLVVNGVCTPSFANVAKKSGGGGER